MSSLVYGLSPAAHSFRLAQRQRNFPAKLRGRGLLVRGLASQEDFRGPAVAIVGTRRPTAYGIRFVREFVAAWRKAGLQGCVVSGGALGIDGEAHAAALRHGIPTHAWLVGPVERPGPQAHARLFTQIAATPGSALIVPERLQPRPDRPTRKADWVERNQWLVAAADALVVVEARKPSGTWSSVQVALDYGLPVYLLPGPFDSPASQGINSMIADGCGKSIESVKGLIQSLVVELGMAFYNEREDSGLLPEVVGGNGLVGSLEPPLEEALLNRLREILNRFGGLTWVALWGELRGMNASMAEVLRHLHAMQAQGELQVSGDRFERRGI
jgi:DNA protecting protein DprA